MSEAAFSINPLATGAEVCGLAPGADRDPAVREALYAAWLEYGVLLFHGVDSIERHLALSRCFGELEIHPMPEVRSELDPYLIDLGGPQRNAAYVYDEHDLRINRIAWHRDTAYTPDICKGAMLRMVEVPVHEGETMVADTAKAYDDLPAEMKARLEGLEYKASLRIGPFSQSGPGAVWKTVRRATREEDPVENVLEEKPGLAERYPPVIQPAVLTHPESGRKCIFLSPTYVDRFLGMTQEESDDLLSRLCGHMLQPRYIYKHKWRANDALIWDNRRCMHAGMGNRPDEPRWGLRTTLAGPMRTGRYYRADARSNSTPLPAD